MFIVSGWLMLVLAVGNYFMSRWVELRLLKKAGCQSTHDYAERLTVIEKQTLEAKVGLRFRRVAPRQQEGGIDLTPKRADFSVLRVEVCMYTASYVFSFLCFSTLSFSYLRP